MPYNLIYRTALFVIPLTTPQGGRSQILTVNGHCIMSHARPHHGLLRESALVNNTLKFGAEIMPSGMEQSLVKTAKVRPKFEQAKNFGRTLAVLTNFYSIPEGNTFKAPNFNALNV